jgi:photosystem II stability/assembly factor-like uncharacterized protein
LAGCTSTPSLLPTLPSPTIQISPGQATPSSSAGPSFVPTSPVALSASGGVIDAGSFAGGGLWAIRESSLFISTDLGTSWQRHALPVGPSSLVAGWTFAALDARHAWLATYGPGTTGSTGTAADVVDYLVSRTDDGGATWRTTKIAGSYWGTVPALAFADARHGYLLAVATRLSAGASTVLRTIDGGATWVIAATKPWLDGQIAVSDVSTLWAGGQEQAGGLFAQHILAVSRDAGRTWHDAELPGVQGTTEATCGCFLARPPLFTSSSTGFVTVVNAFGSNGQYGTTVETTTDGGRTWSEASSRPDIQATGLAVLDSRHWMMTLINPTEVDATVDGGLTWQTAASGGDWADTFAASIGSLGGNDAAALVQLPGEANSASSASMALLLTTDGGRTWRQLFPE